MKRFDRIVAERTSERRDKAVAASRAALDALSAMGLDAKVIGSLATGRFMQHSDVDLLVRGSVTSRERAEIDRRVGLAFAGTGIPCDVVLKGDLVTEQAEAFEHGAF